WNHAEVLAGFIKDLHSRVRCDVQPSLRIDGAAVAGSASFELREITAVRQHAGTFDIKSNDSVSVGHIQSFVIGAEHNTVCANVVRDDTDCAFRTGVVNATGCEVHAA